MDKIYAIKWTFKQLWCKLRKTPMKGYKKILTFNEIIKLGGIFK